MGDRGPELARASEFEDATDTDSEGGRSSGASAHGELEAQRRDLMSYVNAWPEESIPNPNTNERQAQQKITDFLAHWTVDRGYESSFKFFECLMESSARSFEYWNTLPDPTRGRAWPANRKRRMFRTPAMKYGLRSALERQLGCGNGATPELLQQRQARIREFLRQLSHVSGVRAP